MLLLQDLTRLIDVTFFNTPLKPVHQYCAINLRSGHLVRPVAHFSARKASCQRVRQHNCSEAIRNSRISIVFLRMVLLLLVPASGISDAKNKKKQLLPEYVLRAGCPASSYCQFTEIDKNKKKRFLTSRYVIRAGGCSRVPSA